jgi:hypothetical protein
LIRVVLAIPLEILSIVQITEPKAVTKQPRPTPCYKVDMFTRQEQHDGVAREAPGGGASVRDKGFEGNRIWCITHCLFRGHVCLDGLCKGKMVEVGNRCKVAHTEKGLDVVGTIRVNRRGFIRNVRGGEDGRCQTARLQLGMETRLTQQVPPPVVGGRTRDYFSRSWSSSMCRPGVCEGC